MRLDFKLEFKKAQNEARKKGIAVIFTRPGLAVIYLMVLAVFPDRLLSIATVAITGLLYYARYRKEWWKELLLIPLYAIAFFAGVSSKKGPQPAMTTAPQHIPATQGEEHTTEP